MARKKKRRRRDRWINKKLRSQANPLRLGYSPVHKTASAAGPHGGNKKEEHRRQRREGKQQLRNGDW